MDGILCCIIWLHFNSQSLPQWTISFFEVGEVGFCILKMYGQLLKIDG